MIKRSQIPVLSPSGQQALAQYEQFLRTEQDLRPATVRNYLSDLRQFIAWCENGRTEASEELRVFKLQVISTPLLTRYRTYLQNELGLKPASVNRFLVSLKKYCSWATEQGLLLRDPARVVKLVDQQQEAPRHLSDEEEGALVSAVEAEGNL